MAILIWVVGKVLFAFVRRYALKEQKSNEYHDAIALRQEVERKSRRSLTDGEWAMVAPNWSEPYDDLDVAELVQAVREALSHQRKPSLEEKARRHRRAHVERAALEAREMVESFRKELFGHKEPPFPNRRIEAAEWIEAQAQKPETKRFNIEVTVPVGLGRLESLIWLRDYLAENLSPFSPADSDDDSLRLRQSLEACPAVRKIGWAMPLLTYLGVNPEGEIEIKRVQAPDGTLLGRLQRTAEQLAKSANWKPYAAVHHLLTGGIVAPSAVQGTSQYRAGRQVFGDSHPIKLEISDTGSVIERDLITAFRRERSSFHAPGNQLLRQRARVASKSERVAALVAETPGISWSNRVGEWNRRYPEERYRTTSAMKEAYRRAILR
jgi:hypothetical protein